MKFKWIILAALLIVTVTAVSAADNSSLQETPSLEIEVDDEPQIISAQPDEIITETDNGTFAALEKKISDASPNAIIELENDYACEDDFGAGGITIDKPLTIDGKGFTIDAKSKSVIFTITSSGVVLRNMTFMNGHSTYYGGAVSSSNNCSIISCSFVHCCGEWGSAIFNSGSSCNISSCSFVKGFATYDCGAIYNTGENCTINSCSFTDCSASYHGYGSIFNSGGYCTINSCMFTNCSADDNGGAIYNDGDSCTINAGIFTNCSARRGGAIFTSGSSCNISSCFFTNCSANFGEAIYNEEGNCTVSNCNFTDSRQSRACSGNIEVINSTFNEVLRDPKLKVTIDDFEEGETGLIIVRADSDYSGKATVKILESGQIYSFYVEDSYGAKTIKKLPAGNYVAQVVLSESGDFSQSELNSTFQVTPRREVPTRTISDKNDMTVIELPKDASGTVTVFVDGAKYAVLNIVNGVAKIDLSKFKSGDHLIKFVYSGDEKYASFTKKMTITPPAKKTKTKVTLKKVKVKKSAKKL
ncbi:MAG: hypothetical protein BZ138_07245, partial [Methanosphaera sp. rholeuAM270]